MPPAPAIEAAIAIASRRACPASAISGANWRTATVIGTCRRGRNRLAKAALSSVQLFSSSTT